MDQNVLYRGQRLTLTRFWATGEPLFCVYSQYIDDLMMLAKMIRVACADEKAMGMYLNMSEAAKA